MNEYEVAKDLSSRMATQSTNQKNQLWHRICARKSLLCDGGICMHLISVIGFIEVRRQSINLNHLTIKSDKIAYELDCVFGCANAPSPHACTFLTFQLHRPMHPFIISPWGGALAHLTWPHQTQMILNFHFEHSTDEYFQMMRAHSIKNNRWQTEKNRFRNRNQTTKISSTKKVLHSEISKWNQNCFSLSLRRSNFFYIHLLQSPESMQNEWVRSACVYDIEFHIVDCAPGKYDTRSRSERQKRQEKWDTHTLTQTHTHAQDVKWIAYCGWLFGANVSIFHIIQIDMVISIL